MADGVVWVSAATLGLVAVSLGWLGRVADRLGRANRKLDLLLRHSGVDVAAVADREAAELLRAGKKIEAIRVYRGLTGAPLAEAKRHVEGLQGRA